MLHFYYQTVSDNKIKIPILILRRGALSTKELRGLMRSTSLPAIDGHHHHQYHPRNVNQRRGNHHHNQTFAVGALNLGQLSIGLGLGFR